MQKHILLKIFAVTFCLLTLVSLSQAQYRGSLRGVVTDPQGAVIQGATVTLLNTDTNAKMTAKSDNAGIYVFNALPTANYRLTIEQAGFKKKVLERVLIIPDQLNGLDVQLDVGQQQETVMVSGTTQTLDTETATVGATITTRQVSNMPSLGRDVFKLVQLAPGVFSEGQSTSLPTMQGQGPTGGADGIFKTENGPAAISAGQQYENNSYSLDGISTTSAVWGGTSIVTPTEEAVQEVKVVSNAYDAENGRFAGAQVQVTSKSGTNKFHGSAFFTAHRPGLNATRWVGENETPLKDDNFFSQFGGSISGPIWKNKVFGMFAWETVRSPQAQANHANGWYETSAFASSARPGSIAAQYLSFAGSRPSHATTNSKTCVDAGLVEGVNCHAVAGQGLDIGSPLTSALGSQDLSWVSSNNPGVGSGLDGIADIVNLSTTTGSNYTKNQYAGRVDANLTSRDRLAGSIYWIPQSTDFLNGAARDYNYFHHTQKTNAFSLIWNRTVSDSFVNEARFNAAGWRWNEITSNPQSPVGLPSDYINGIGSVSMSSFGPNVGSILDQWTYSYKDVATKVWGRNTIKFGGELTRLYYLNNCVGCGVPSYNFFNMWSFLNDAPKSQGGGYDPHTGVPTTIRQDDRQDIWGFFLHDDIRVRRNLTINAGLRWSLFSGLRDKGGRMYKATPGEGSAYLTGLTVATGHSWNPEWNNFGPQIGFSWSPTLLKDKLVIRGGYGLNYSQLEIAISAGIQNNPGLITWPGFLNMELPSDSNPGIIYAVASNIHSYTYPANPNVITSFDANGLPSSGSTGVVIFPQTMPTMRVHHYSVDAQYDLGHNWIASLGYQGSKSHNILNHHNPLALAASKGYALSSQISGGDDWNANGYGSYNAFLAEVKHQFGHGLMLDGQFTWSQTKDTGSGPYVEMPYVLKPSLNYALSDYDVARAYKLYGSWSPMFFHDQKSWKSKVMDGWTISGIFNAHSGFPWTPIASFGGYNMYCSNCYGYNYLPAIYKGGAGNSTSNDAFKTGSNYPSGGSAYFTVPNHTTYINGAYGNANPTVSSGRNSLRGPNYRSIDATLIKAFGLPANRILGEDARFEFRVDAYNLFNNLNLLGGSSNIENGHIRNDISLTNFGTSNGSYAGRIVTLGARFNF